MVGVNLAEKSCLRDKYDFKKLLINFLKFLVRLMVLTKFYGWNP